MTAVKSCGNVFADLGFDEKEADPAGGGGSAGHIAATGKRLKAWQGG